MHSTAALIVRLRCLFDSSSVHRWSSMGSSRRPHHQLRLRRARHSRSRRPPCATCHRARRQALLDGIGLVGVGLLGIAAHRHRAPRHDTLLSCTRTRVRLVRLRLVRCGLVHCSFTRLRLVLRSRTQCVRTCACASALVL